MSKISDFFSMSKQERRGAWLIVAFIILILVAIVIERKCTSDNVDSKTQKELNEQIEKASKIKVKEKKTSNKSSKSKEKSKTKSKTKSKSSGNKKTASKASNKKSTTNKKDSKTGKKNNSSKTKKSTAPQRMLDPVPQF